MTDVSLETPSRNLRTNADRDAAPKAGTSPDAALADLRIETDGITPGRWEEILDLFADATYDQTATYSGHGWGDDRLSHLVLYRGDSIVAAAQVVVLKVPALPRGLAFVKFGPLWRRKGASADTAILSAVLTALQREYAGARGHMLTVLPPPDPEFLQEWPALLGQAGFRQRREMTDPNRYLVNLSLDHEAQRASLAQKWRYNLNKSAKNDLHFVTGRDEAHVHAFVHLYKEMLGRKDFSDGGSFDAVPKMIARLPEAMRPEIVLGYHNDVATVGAVVAPDRRRLAISVRRHRPPGAGAACRLRPAMAHSRTAKGRRREMVRPRRRGQRRRVAPVQEGPGRQAGPDRRHARRMGLLDRSDRPVRGRHHVRGARGAVIAAPSVRPHRGRLT